MELIDFVKEYWTILSTLVLVIIAFTRMESAIRYLRKKDDEQEKKIETIQQDIKSNDLEFKKIEISIEGIRTDVAFIKEHLLKK